MTRDNPTHKSSIKKGELQDAFLAAFDDTPTIGAACETAGIVQTTFNRWISEGGAFATVYREKARSKEARTRQMRVAAKAQYGLLWDHRRELPGKGTFAQWRRKYTGRPVSDHQTELVEAYTDPSNLVIISLMPPGAGKDTTAGDFLLYETCDNRRHRAAWVMRGETFSKRRVAERLDPYLSDRRTYDNAPEGPDCTVPEGSLIDDYGPFKYKQGMVDGDGNKLEATTWTKNEIYFLNTGAPEADPNLWATGMEGQMYGSRIDTLVMSDVFDRENQLTMTKRESQYAWVMGTALSRLDESGRLIILGTRCLPGDNYERIINSLIGEAPVVHEGKHYTKYGNGVAVIIMPAIQTDADGNDISYWPERFPLESQYELPGGNRVPIQGANHKELLDKYGNAKRIRGLYEIRTRDRELFATMYQQAPPDEATGDFSSETLDHGDDEDRTFGVYRPSELLIVGVDPARSAGAAWVAWGVDRDKQTITLVDYFFGDKLGISGIKSQLVVKPITMYDPVWYCYETNREAAVIEDPEISRLFTDFAVNVYRHHTHHANRKSMTIGVPAMSFYMRNGTIRWPAMLATDRDRMAAVKDHFQTWDRKEALGTQRASLKGQPDDIAMAAWVGFVKALEMMQRGNRGTKMPTMPVPKSVRDRWERMQQRASEKRYTDKRERPGNVAVNMRDIVSLALGGSDDADLR